MVSFNNKKDCAAFLKTKRQQGFISDKTWDKILTIWNKCSSDEEYKNLASGVYKNIALANGIIPLSYFN